MRRTHYYHIVSAILRLVMILGLLGMPSTGWGQEQNIQSEVSIKSSTEETAISYIDERWGFRLLVPQSWHIEPASLFGWGGVTSISSFDPNNYPPEDEIPTGQIKLDIGVLAVDKPANKSFATWVESTALANAQIQNIYVIQTLDIERATFDIAIPNTSNIARHWYWHDREMIYFAVAMSSASTSMEAVQKIVDSINFVSNQDSIISTLHRIDKPVINEDLSALSSAPEGYRLPFGGTEEITTGPGCYTTHKGVSSEAIDYGLSSGTSVYATQDGDVVYAGWDTSGYGNLIKIKHTDGNISYYGHLNAFNLQNGDKGVKRGQIIGHSGNTGNSTGAHLHFEVRNPAGNGSVWMRDLPTSTWFTGNINAPCMPAGQNDGEATFTENQGPCNDNQQPEGNYDQPSNNQRVSGNVTLKGWAKDDCGVDAVEFTATWPGQGWHVLKRVDNDCSRGQSCSYEHSWNLSNVPAGAIVTLGYDIFDKNGKVSRSPNGTRNILKLGPCSAPGLIEPGENTISENHSFTFRWNGLSDCDLGGGYTLRIRTDSNMNSTALDSTVLDTGVGDTQKQVTIDTRWDDRDLYWSVKAVNGANWASPRRLRVTTNRLPDISFNTANNNTADTINSRDQIWTFTGTASDPENKLNRVEFHCSGDSCNETKNIGNSGDWSYTRDGLTGENRIWFTACDDKQCRDSDKKLTLRVDLAPPTTTADANGQANPSGWFRGPVDVKIRAQDGATGHAVVGVREIRYRVDGGGWQSSGGDSKTITINMDGQHTVEYYAVDQLDNQESPAKSVRFQIDATPPTAPGAATETHGVVNDQWQKAVGAPEFTWGASADSTSGLQHYELYFGPDANSDQIQSFVAATADRRWTPLPNGVRTGAYYLRARACDNAGNYSAWSTLFTFRYDVTPPANPTEASHTANLISGSWQRTSAAADFTWPVPNDEGSGIKGYYVYWGDQPEGKDESVGAFRTGASYQSAGPLCTNGQACTGYLRVRSIDKVDNPAGDWSTLFTLRYDGAAPTLDFTINGGVTQTAQTQVSLNLNAVDQGSGVHDVRSFASSGWSPWEAYGPERIETIPAIGRQSWPVYVQVRDAVGWESAVVSKTVYFEVNRPQPKSANFWLFDSMVNAGNGNHASSHYQGSSSVGQSVDSAPIASANYMLNGGYQAASQALPLQIPGHDEYTFVSGVFASGIVNDTMQSAQYRLRSSIGQIGLPENRTTISSASYQLQPGFLAAVPSAQTTPTPPPTPTPGPSPTPEPPKGCEFATLTINNRALFTNNPNVSLELCAPNAAEMKVSNDGSFANVNWEPYRTTKGWTLSTLGQNVIARLVQARFKDTEGLTHHYAIDDIIYDPTAPNGAVAINDPASSTTSAQSLAADAIQAAAVQSTAAMASFTYGDITYVQRLGSHVFDAPVPLLSMAASDGLDVYLIAQDDNSGLAQMQIGESANLDSSAWEPYDGLVQWTPSGDDGEKQLYARFRDSAGNPSAVYSSTVVIDSHPPLGGINIIEDIIGENAVTVKLYLAAEDNLSSIPAIRLSHDPTFTDAPWQPFAAELTWPIQVNENETEKIIYAQFRDAAGNISQTYSDAVIIDRQPPIMYVEVEPGETLARQVNLYAYDELSSLSTMQLSNDPLMIEAVVTLPYSDTVSWTFDDRRVVWVEVTDSVGNVSEPYPAYAADANEPPGEENKIFLPLINR